MPGLGKKAVILDSLDSLDQYNAADSFRSPVFLCWGLSGVGSYYNCIVEELIQLPDCVQVRPLDLQLTLNMTPL